MSNKPQFVFLKDADGDVGDQLNKLNQQDNTSVITYYEHYDKAHDNSGVIACYIKLGVNNDESNGTTEK